MCTCTVYKKRNATSFLEVDVILMRNGAKLERETPLHTWSSTVAPRTYAPWSWLGARQARQARLGRQVWYTYKIYLFGDGYIVVHTGCVKQT